MTRMEGRPMEGHANRNTIKACNGIALRCCYVDGFNKIRIQQLTTRGCGQNVL